jgi:DNA (cytosine-5)-methyltransferase 1
MDSNGNDRNLRTKSTRSPTLGMRSIRRTNVQANLLPRERPRFCFLHGDGEVVSVVSQKRCRQPGFLDHAGVVSRIKELIEVEYFGKRRVSLKSVRILEPMLQRLGLRANNFDSKSLALLANHRRAICGSKPKCERCPLVSFCKFGVEQVKRGSKPAVIDLFGGAGGMGYGFRRAGFRIALAVEQDRDAAQTYRFNNPGVFVLEANVAEIHATDVKKIFPARPSVVCAGPPCQSYSAAGLRKPRDPRHHLFQHVLSISRVLKPDVVLIENVPGVDKVAGRNFRRIIERAIGNQFQTEVHLLRALDYGIPQVRRRYFFIGRHENLAPIGKPRPTHKEKDTYGQLPQAPTVMDALRGLPYRKQGQPRDWTRMPDGTMIWNVGTMAHSPRVVRKIKKIRGAEGPISYRRLSRYYANTIIAGHRALPVHPTRNRTMSVREAAQIQGFDPAYIFLGRRANQPLQVANAVPPPLAEAIARRIKRVIVA